MSNHSEAARQYSAGIEDILLAVLGLLAGPLLWWISQTWQLHPDATSVQTMEYWIAVICGFIGIGLITIWMFFLLAGLGFAIALKTRNKIITYWSGLFTPKFLQRIIISVIGIQLTLSSQALAAEETPAAPTEAATVQDEDPFMPEVADLPALASEEPAAMPSATPTPVQSPTAQPAITPETMDPTNSPTPTLSPQPRQSSHITPDTEATDSTGSGSSEPELQPMPRQTTTTPVEQSPADDALDHDAPKPGIPQAFLPQKPLPSPYIAAPNPHRTTADPTVVVQTGDSLWDIAHQELGADATLMQIDDRWRQWWQHNHDVIGTDPHTLTPGMVLTAPPFSH